MVLFIKSDSSINKIKVKKNDFFTLKKMYEMYLNLTKIDDKNNLDILVYQNYVVLHNLSGEKNNTAVKKLKVMDDLRGDVLVFTSSEVDLTSLFEVGFKLGISTRRLMLDNKGGDLEYIQNMIRSVVLEDGLNLPTQEEFYIEGKDLVSSSVYFTTISSIEKYFRIVKDFHTGMNMPINKDIDDEYVDEVMEKIKNSENASKFDLFLKNVVDFIYNELIANIYLNLDKGKSFISTLYPLIVYTDNALSINIVFNNNDDLISNVEFMISYYVKHEMYEKCEKLKSILDRILKLV